MKHFFRLLNIKKGLAIGMKQQGDPLLLKSKKDEAIAPRRAKNLCFIAIKVVFLPWEQQALLPHLLHFITIHYPVPEPL